MAAERFIWEVAPGGAGLTKRVVQSSSSSTSSTSCSSKRHDQNDGLVPFEKGAVHAWLKRQGFKKPSKLESVQQFCMFRPPIHMLTMACHKGELHVCKWLHAHGAAAYVTEADEHGATPMHHACENGHLSVCKWLLEVGASITKADKYGVTPMHAACGSWVGSLPLCQWLFQNGAAGDIRSVTRLTHHGERGYDGHRLCGGHTPMGMALESQNLSICDWLCEMGATRDIFRKDQKRKTASQYAFQNEVVLEVCYWLVLKGALNHPDGEDDDGNEVEVIEDNEDDDEEDDDENSSGRGGDDDDDDGAASLAGHVDESKVYMAVEELWSPTRRDLRDWAENVLKVHNLFLGVFLSGTVVPTSRRRRRKSPRHCCLLPILPVAVLDRVRDMLGVEKGRRLRNVREFKDCLLIAEERLADDSDHDSDADLFPYL